MRQRACLPLPLWLCLLMAMGCHRASQPVPADGDTFQSLLDVSMQELKVKTEAHQAWGLGTFDRWNVDQERGEIVFSNADGKRVVAPAQIIGSFSTNDNSWLWAWDNPSVVDGMKKDARKLKEYGEKNNIEKLTTRKWTGTQDEAWEMAALAVKLCNAQGAYRGPSGKTFVFMTFGDVKISNSKSAVP